MKLLINNRLISIDNFSMGYTYSTLLYGRPDYFINQVILDNIAPPSDWPQFAKFKLPVHYDQMLSKMPECYYHAALISDPLSNEYCASGLILSWLDEVPGDRTIPVIVEQALTQVNWEISSEGFDY